METPDRVELIFWVLGGYFLGVGVLVSVPNRLDEMSSWRDALPGGGGGGARLRLFGLTGTAAGLVCGLVAEWFWLGGAVLGVLIVVLAVRFVRQRRRRSEASDDGLAL